MALAFAASATSSGTAVHSKAVAAAGAGNTTKVGALTVRFTIRKFVRRGARLYAVGTTITRFSPTADNPQSLPTKVVRKAFTARVIRLKTVASAQKICSVLDLTLGPLDLNLLGLIVHLDRVHLTITADSNGGLLGHAVRSIFT